MSLKLQKQIDQLRKDRDEDRVTIKELATQYDWFMGQAKDGFKDILARMADSAKDYEFQQENEEPTLPELVAKLQYNEWQGHDSTLNIGE
tara:strand:- start:1866 stop:2135 length:270 start_codon:yes stop_codon:yes gene_type:complete